MVLSQEDQSRNHSTTTEIVHEFDIGYRLVSRIIDQDLDLHPLRKPKVLKITDSNIKKHMLRSRKLLSMYTQRTLQTVFFCEIIL